MPPIGMMLMLLKEAIRPPADTRFRLAALGLTSDQTLRTDPVYDDAFSECSFGKNSCARKLN